MIRIQSDRASMFTRRAFFIGACQLAGVSALVARLYYLQFLRADEYKTLAEGNRIKLQLIPPARGMLLDRNGIPLALNEENFRVVMEPDISERDLETLRRVTQLIEIGPNHKDELTKKVKAARISLPILIKEHLTWEEVSKIEYNTPDLPGVFIDVGKVRSYPFKEQAAHLIGYVGKVSEKDNRDKPVMRLPDFKIGKDGVEKILEEEIQGTAGIKHVEVNVHSLPVRELSSQESIPGRDINLTIDARLQKFAANRLGDESGGIIVMNVQNGNILALVSQPGFDPNRFSMGITNDYWKELNANKKHPLINKAIAGQYPPGSTFKMLVGLAALEAGTDPNASVYCPGYFYLGSHQFRCWKKEGHGSVNCHSAIAQSCDTYYYTMAQRLGIEKIADMCRRFGLGATYGILPGERPGIVPDPDWKRKRYNQPWHTGDTINVGIGQGYVLATPLQLAVMTTRIANGKYQVMPRLYVPEEEKGKPPKFKELGVKPELVGHIRQGMADVTMSPWGTAYAKRIKQPGMEMAGKTGTSQVRKITVQGVNQDSIPWEHRHHALFVGYAPLENPKYSVAVMIEHGGGGASAAAPVARDVLWRMQQFDVEDAEKEKNKPRKIT